MDARNKNQPNLTSTEEYTGGLKNIGYLYTISVNLGKVAKVPMGKMETNGQSQTDGVDQLQLLFPLLHIPHELQIPKRREHLIGIAWVTCLSLGQGKWGHFD